MIERLLVAESLLARDELDAAERQFSLVADADPRNAIAVVGLARIAARRGDAGGALALTRRALDIDPDEAAAARLLAELDGEPTVAVARVPEHAREQASEAAAPNATPAPATPAPATRWWRRWLDRLRRRG